MAHSPSPRLDLSTASRAELVARIQQLESSGSQGSSDRRHETPSAATEPSPLLSKSAARRLLKQQAILELAGQQQQRLAPQQRSSASDYVFTSSASDTAFFDRYGTRKIALKFSYEGWPYSGLALQDDTGPLPTVEGVLLDALVRARLIRPEQRRDLEGLGFARCGRTDRGVSAAGQVVNLWVRSQLDAEQGMEEPAWRPPVAPAVVSTDTAASEDIAPASTQTPEQNLKQKQKVKAGPRSELPYMALLNRCLPPSIRVHGWSPVSEDFDARFSCTSRHYKYFFSTPCGGAHLDVQAMQDAADRLVGEHDFRNLCKVDPTKQIVNFQRGILEARISPLASTDHPPLASGDTAPTNGASESLVTGQQHFVFDLKGTAFLYHQVRHIMAVLFLVGSEREDPSVVDSLITTGYGPDSPTAGDKGDVVASKPVYEMADELPLVLWDCTYPSDAFPGGWRQGDEQARTKAYNTMEEHTTQLQLRATIAEHFKRAFSELPTHPEACTSIAPATEGKKKEKTVVQIGGGRTANTGRYVPLLQRPRGELVEVINKRWADGQGKRKAERKAAAVSAGAANGDDAMSLMESEP